MEENNQNNLQIEYPLLIDRIKSTLIDSVLLIVLMFCFSLILNNFKDTPDWVRIFLFTLIFIIYDPLCTSLGCTLGNYIVGLRVRRKKDLSEKINIFQAIIRYALKVLLGWISFLTINANKERRAIHDLVVGSIVIVKR
jgi:uncharacterized RDD family membrane protein YckC